MYKLFLLCFVLVQLTIATPASAFYKAGNLQVGVGISSAPAAPASEPKPATTALASVFLLFIRRR
jgi:hypothetical protein